MDVGVKVGEYDWKSGVSVVVICVSDALNFHINCVIVCDTLDQLSVMSL